MWEKYPVLNDEKLEHNLTITCDAIPFVFWHR